MKIYLLHSEIFHLTIWTYTHMQWRWAEGGICPTKLPRGAPWASAMLCSFPDCFFASRSSLGTRLCYAHVNLHRHVPCQSYLFTSPPPPTLYCCARLCSHEQEYQALLAFYTESMWGAANMRSLFISGLTSLYDFSGGYLDRISCIGKRSSLISFCLKANVLLISC